MEIRVKMFPLYWRDENEALHAVNICGVRNAKEAKEKYLHDHPEANWADVGKPFSTKIQLSFDNPEHVKLMQYIDKTILGGN